MMTARRLFLKGLYVIWTARFQMKVLRTLWRITRPIMRRHPIVRRDERDLFHARRILVRTQPELRRIIACDPEGIIAGDRWLKEASHSSQIIFPKILRPFERRPHLSPGRTIRIIGKSQDIRKTTRSFQRNPLPDLSAKIP